MDPIHQCPLTTKERSIRSGQVQCNDVNSYHCLRSAVDGQLKELCTSPIWIEAGKCSVYSQTGQLDSNICQSNLPGKCPTNVYRSNEAFNYPACLPMYRDSPSTRRVDGEVRRDNTTTFSSGTGAAGAGLTALYVVVVLIVLLAIGLGIAWWKKRIIRRWISGLVTNLHRHGADVKEKDGTEEKIAATAQSSSLGAGNENNVESSEPLLAATSTNGDDSRAMIKAAATQNSSRAAGNENNVESSEPLPTATTTKGSKERKEESKGILSGNTSTRTKEISTCCIKNTAYMDERNPESFSFKDISKGSQLSADASYKTTKQSKLCTLLRENDVLVLCWGNEKEIENHCLDIAMTVCTEIGNGNIRHVLSPEEFTFQNLEAEKVQFIIFSDFATNLKLFGKKNCSESFTILSSIHSESKGMHAMICIPKKKKNELSHFLETLETSSLHHTCHMVPQK